MFEKIVLKQLRKVIKKTVNFSNYSAWNLEILKGQGTAKQVRHNEVL